MIVEEQNTIAIEPTTLADTIAIETITIAEPATLAEPTTDPATLATEKYKELTSWEDLDAKVPLLRGIYAYGFETPSPIQKKAILPIFDKRDIIAQAQSGTGKTACFTIGALQLIDTNKRTNQAIILSSR